jgi:DNA-binding protein HU-beta
MIMGRGGWPQELRFVAIRPWEGKEQRLIYVADHLILQDLLNIFADHFIINQNRNIMNKAELIGAIASEAKMSKANAKKALEAFIKSTSQALKKGDRVALVGFGTFHVAKRSARTGRNPRTGSPIKIPAKKVAQFRPGAELKKTVK